jgi:hypothetical protein
MNVTLAPGTSSRVKPVRCLHPSPSQSPRKSGLVAGALNQLSEREGECRDASDEHDESECRDASRNQPEPSRSELPSQSE